jgi:hypothetical protein
MLHLRIEDPRLVVRDAADEALEVILSLDPDLPDRDE